MEVKTPEHGHNTPNGGHDGSTIGLLSTTCYRLGSAAWPSPLGGNWGEVLEVILKESISSLSTVAAFTKTASEVIDAYQTEDFDVVEMDHVEFDANYRGLTREECSHSVAFTADQQPDTDGMIDILSSAQDSLNGDVGAVVYLYPESGDLPKPPQYSDTTTSYSDMFDEMSEEELAEYEIQRIPYEQRKDRIPSHQKPSDRDVPKRPVYTTSFEPDVDFDVKNGRIINSEVYKY